MDLCSNRHYTSVVLYLRPSIIFQMKDIDAFSLGIIVLFTVIVFIVMEVEEAISRHLKFDEIDTDDMEYTMFYNPVEW